MRERPDLSVEAEEKSPSNAELLVRDRDDVFPTGQSVTSFWNIEMCCLKNEKTSQKNTKMISSKDCNLKEKRAYIRNGVRMRSHSAESAALDALDDDFTIARIWNGLEWANRSANEGRGEGIAGATEGGWGSYWDLKKHKFSSEKNDK